MARRRKNPLAGMNPPPLTRDGAAAKWQALYPELQAKMLAKRPKLKSYEAAVITDRARNALIALVGRDVSDDEIRDAVLSAMTPRRGNPQDYSLCIICDKKLDDQARRHGSRVCKRCTPRGYVPEGARHGGFDRPDRDDLGRYEGGRRGNPVYPVRARTTPPYPHPPVGFVDAPDIFAADRLAQQRFGAGAMFGVGYANLDRARAREVTCACQHGTTPEGYPWFEPCPAHRAEANKKRPNPKKKRRKNPLEVTTSARNVVHRVATAKSRSAKCGETDGSASVHASQVTCPDCRSKRKKPKRK